MNNMLKWFIISTAVLALFALMYYARHDDNARFCVEKTTTAEQLKECLKVLGHE